MIPESFKYMRADDMEHVLSLLSNSSEDIQILAGCHSLLPLLKMRMGMADTVLDVQNIPDLKGIQIETSHIRIGAMTTHAELTEHAELNREWPIFAQTGIQIADAQVRNHGTIGGSVCLADPSSDWPVILCLLNAELLLKSQTGERIVPFDEFVLGAMDCDLQEFEILTEIRIPRNSLTCRSSYQKFRHPASGYAVASAAGYALYDGNNLVEKRLAIGGTAEKPYQAGFDAADVCSDAEVLSDHFAPSAYRASLANTMAKRARRACLNPI
ncbi:MAG: FAD binding domain-containing protein [Sneathiella sp.]|nr:FAD binding domain-containing protein [Sneathiella sp.]